MLLSRRLQAAAWDCRAGRLACGDRATTFGDEETDQNPGSLRRKRHRMPRLRRSYPWRGVAYRQACGWSAKVATQESIPGLAMCNALLRGLLKRLVGVCQTA